MRRAVVAAVALAGGLAAAGPGLAQTRTYLVEVENTWSTATHPGAFPPAAHFSHFGGAVHSAAADFWSEEELASPGMVRMAETGSITALDDEVLAAIGDGTASLLIYESHWFCPPETSHPSCGPMSFEIGVSPEFPLVTMVSMLGPSPDWFVGIDGEPLMVDGVWAREKSFELHPYDGGTRDNNVFELFGPQTIPQDPITLITAESGQVMTPASLGSITFTLRCPEDLDGDGSVGSSDLGALLASWGQPGAADLRWRYHLSRRGRAISGCCSRRGARRAGKR